MTVVKGDVFYSDSDSDDDDVDRYVFLARQPAPAPAAGRHADDDRGVSSENDGGGDDDGESTADGGEPERGGGMRKRKPLSRREILDAASPPPPKKKKKAGVELIAPPLAQATPPPSYSGSETESDSAPSPCGVRAAGESGSEGSHGTNEHHRAPGIGIGGEAKNATKKKMKRGACVKRRRGLGCDDEDGDPAVTAAAAAKAGDAPPAATSKRFVCSLCERSFDSYRALGGHVLGHRKKAKIATAAAAACLDDVGDAGGGVIGNCKDESAVVEASQETTGGGISLHVHKMAAAAARHGKADGGGGDRKFKTVHHDVAEHREDVGSGGHDDDANGNASFHNKGNAIAGASGKDFKTLASGSDGNVSKTMMYKCKVCGAECSTGRALGGHMRKHRKPPALVGGGGEGRSSASPPTDDDCQIPLARMFGAETGLQRENKIGWV
ncbi:unnamed protein product [Urochloa decumbens]|uniref:C2H2-type domain-containing protein n=1 Tax=Urochloa decumbens TaxID=240449 RepID=A0ABC8YN32_9POAL